MATCNELYRRTPAGLAPEIAFFTPADAGDAASGRHTGDAGGGDFTVKPQARSPRAAAPRRPGALARGAALTAGRGPGRPWQGSWHLWICSAPCNPCLLCNTHSARRPPSSALTQLHTLALGFVQTLLRRDSGSARWRQDSHNLLRPEAVESLFVLWRVTGDARYREWGWHMFRAWHRFCRVPTGGFTNLESVLTVRAHFAVCFSVLH